MKTKAKKKSDAIVLEYSLLDLPTAQHKAGLMGMVLHVESLRKRKVAKPIPELVELTPRTAVIKFTLPQIQTLFDDLYDASWVEDERQTKYQNKPPKRVKTVIVTENGKTRREKRFVYDRCVPSGHALRFFQARSDGPWIKLWRDMLWNVLRAQPKTRGDYESRADRKSLALPKEFWKKLARAEQKRSKGSFEVAPVAGSVFVGAQADNAERVPFLGRVEHNLLLHFWQWVTPIYVPRVVGANDDKPKNLGHLLAIPEVSDLELFGVLIRDFWRSLDHRVAGYVPAQALIDIPEEGALDFLYQLARHELQQQEISAAVHAIEFYHLERQGNNVRMLAAQRIAPDPRMLSEYQRIRKHVRGPLFKSLRIRNLLAGRYWHEGAESLFSGYPWKHFVHTTESPRFGFFGADTRTHFKGLITELEKNEELPMTEQTAETRDDALARRIYRVIGAFVRHRTRDKTGKDDSAFPKNDKGYPDYSRDYLEAREKVAKDAFLSMRARRDADFIEYFTGAICAVPHFLPEEDYLAVSQALVEEPGKVKNLAMLALSAHSWMPTPKAGPGNENT
ncbi:MAG: type I-MYXAN CRISPR-associated protein Cmx8 [Gammaproteobacteria bacterium]|nr:MAG: type I-MYXAN CRISPR-associated protein Cmx8 [Gammaproteobacteria bacterium]